MRIECRDADGQRCSQRDLELEVYRSGDDINLMLSWWEQPDRPMLWQQGRHRCGWTAQQVNAVQLRTMPPLLKLWQASAFFASELMTGMFAVWLQPLKLHFDDL